MMEMPRSGKHVPDERDCVSTENHEWQGENG